MAQVPARKPAIRTMRSDAEALFKTTKPSLIQMIGTQQIAPPSARLAAPSKVKIPMMLIGVLILAVIGGGAYYLLQTLTSSTNTATPNPRAASRPAAPALFATEASRTITVKKQDRAEFLRLMSDTWRETEREGTVKRLTIMLSDGPQEYPATLADFFEMWRITPPSSLTERLNQNLMVFLYAGKTGNRLGFAVQTREPERTFADMLSWEPALLASISQLFFEERPDAVVIPFEDRTYRNIDWRYLKLSQERDLGVGYAVFPVGNIFVFTVGKEGMETVINRLFDAR
ncbi:MAG: hypothetical protein AAB916_00440 [Patescibacteria group bacterium]